MLLLLNIMRIRLGGHLQESLMAVRHQQKYH
jgi:hypothetical protein